MTLPLSLTFVRHGLSEANRVQRLMKSNRGHELIELLDAKELFGRHDSLMRLAVDGVEQAKVTGQYLKERFENGDSYAPDRFYVSPHTRTRETAAHLKLDGDWIVDDRFRERDWGEVANPQEDFTSGISEISKRLKKMNEWYWKPAGGESLSTGVRTRVESVMESLHRRGDLNNVIAVTHGELIAVARFVIEKMTPDQFVAQEKDPNFKIDNTMVIEYTRVNPADKDDVRTRYHWRRAVCPWDMSRSWNEGEWVEFETRKFSDDELLEFAERTPRLFNDYLPLKD